MLPTTIAQRLSRIDNIATLPHVATEILSMIRNSNTSMRQIARVIEQDPSITAKLLKIANSPFWGFPGRVDNLQRALVLLGLKQVSNIVIGVSLYTTFVKLAPNPEFDREKFWLHSIGTSQIARNLAKQIGLNFHGEEFVASILHDIGKIILDQFFADVFTEILKKAHMNDDSVITWEQKMLGCTHADIGAWLLSHWNFPPSIAAAVHFHHYPERAPTYKDLVSVVRLSDIFCEMWGIGFDDDIKTFSPSDDAAWRILKQHTRALNDLDFERFLFQIDKEMDKARMFIEIAKS